MQAFGSDRLRVREDGMIALSCRKPKNGWNPRIEKTLVHSEHPGTAILWDGEYYEVIDVQVLELGVRYILAPWRDEHVIRTSDRYDAESETARAADLRDVQRRKTTNVSATLFGFLTGHLPARVQQRLADETGVNAPRLTIASFVPGFILLSYCVFTKSGARLAEQVDPVPPWLFILSLFLFFDGGIRAGIAFLQSRPIGSFPGLIAYSIFWALSPNRAKLFPPLGRARGEGLYKAEITPAQHLEASLMMREPVFTLLTEEEQRAIAQHHDYDYRQSATNVASMLMVVALLGAIGAIVTLLSHPRFSAVVSLLAAGYVFVEQVYRLSQFPERPVGSVLAFLARPFAKPFLR